MSTTQIPPVRPDRRNSNAEELYEARYWESAYTETYDPPALLIQLQDDLAQARRREAFWISVVVHLMVVLAIWNSDKLVRLLPRRTELVASTTPKNDKDFTFLEMPPDEQKVTKRPETNILSDKNRTAQSKTPQLNREELKKILEASRAGRPGPSAPASPQQQPSPATEAAQNGQQQAPQQAAPPAAPPSNQMAKLQTPPVGARNPFSGGQSLSPGAAIDQATRAAAANRGGFAGDNGDYGLGLGRQPTATMGPMDILSDTMGVDFGPYLQRVLHDVRLNWYNLIPESAKAPIMKKGKVSIQFEITKDGRVHGLTLISSSGDIALDRGAWGGITASDPFPPLPAEFGGQYLALRFHFFYNPTAADLQ